LADPESGEAETCQPGTRLRTQPAGPQPGGQRRDQRQSRHQTSGQQGCQGRCGITMHVDADIDPGYTAEKQSQSPAAATPQRPTALQALQALVQQGNGQQAQRPDIEGSEGQGSEGTGNQGQQVAAPAGARSQSSSSCASGMGSSCQTIIVIGCRPRHRAGNAS